MADRYLYAPALGFYLLVAALLYRTRAARGALLAVLVLGLSVLALRRTGGVRLLGSRVGGRGGSEPGSALAWVQRGQAAAAAGEWERAADFAARAVALAPRPEILVKARLLRTGSLLGRMASREARGLAPTREEKETVLAEANAAVRLASSLQDLPLVKEDPREVESEAEVLRGQVLERWGDRRRPSRPTSAP